MPNTVVIPPQKPTKPRLDLIPAGALWRVGLHLAVNASDDDPLELYGLPRGDDTTVMDCVASLKRHSEQLVMGETDEDHAAAVASNALFILEILDRVERGLLPQAFDDRPTWYKPRADVFAALRESAQHDGPTACGPNAS